MNFYCQLDDRESILSLKSTCWNCSFFNPLFINLSIINFLHCQITLVVFSIRILLHIIPSWHSIFHWKGNNRSTLPIKDTNKMSQQRVKIILWDFPLPVIIITVYLIALSTESLPCKALAIWLNPNLFDKLQWQKHTK